MERMKPLNPRNAKLIEDYLRACKLGRHGQRRVNSAKREGRIRCALNVFTRDFFHNKPVQELAQEDIEDFFLEWRDGHYKQPGNHQDYSVSTIRTNWLIWKKFYAFSQGWDTMEAPVWLRKLTIGEDDMVEVTPLDRNEFATKQRVDMIAEHMRSPYKRIMLKTLFDWGIGYGEMQAVELSQIQYDPNRQRHFIDFPKGFKAARRPRAISYVWYEKDFVLWLKNHPDWNSQTNSPKDPEAKLFPQITIAAFNKTLKRISQKLFGEKWTSHWMRRGFITHASNEDIPESAIKYRAGLAENTQVLRHYSARTKKRDDLLHQSLARSTTDRLEFNHAARTRELEEKLKATTEALRQQTERQAKIDKLLDLLLIDDKVGEVLTERLRDPTIIAMLHEA